MAKLSPGGNQLVYATYLGGGSADVGNGIAVDGSGAAYAAGNVDSNFPTANAYDTTRAGAQDGFVTKLSPDGSTLAYSTYLGGNSATRGFANAVDSGGQA